MRTLILAAVAALTACNVAPQPTTGRGPSTPGVLTSADFPKPNPGDRVILNRPQAIDGDTIRADDLEVRLFSVDTPEIFSSSRCEQEKAAGIVARDFVQARMDAAKSVVAIVSPEKDKYGRTLAQVEVDGADLGRALIANRSALPYHPGGYDWCPDPANAKPRNP